ncbi:MAG TPA: lipopolysaccharide kinase InaA family protein, partial [Actinomycetota bacterium]|nr:lipopolysaccharide kinase InaA family protein [Actinomycetota bacterium]
MARTVQFRFLAGQEPSNLIDLPWAAPLETWDHPSLVRRTRGQSRHVVRFVNDGVRTFALKEMPDAEAQNEYRLLREIREAGLPVVEGVGVVTGRETAGGEAIPGVLVTRFLEYSLPFRYLFGIEEGAPLSSKLIDAAVVLLVRLHVEGFYWGDCSLSNLLFRRDAGALMAYLVDAETAHRNRPLPDGMREHELDVAHENLAGGLLDLAAEGRLAGD